jgi:hypothetical protein
MKLCRVEFQKESGEGLAARLQEWRSLGVPRESHPGSRIGK